jgi:hypothetical protein
MAQRLIIVYSEKEEIARRIGYDSRFLIHQLLQDVDLGTFASRGRN